MPPDQPAPGRRGSVAHLISRVLPQGRIRRLYVGISLVDSLGSGVFVPVSVLYLTHIVGLSAVQAGLAITIAGAAGLAATPIAGVLCDRFDARVLTSLGFALSGLGFVAYTEVRSFAAALVVGSAIIIVEAIAKAARKMVAFAVAEGEDRVTLLAYERSTRNVGYGLGGLLASLAIAGGSSDAYLAVLLLNAGSYLLGSLAVLKLPKAPPVAHARASGGYRAVFRDRTYVGLAGLSTVLWLNDSILKVGLAIWLVRETTVPAFAVGMLFTLNTAMVVALQVRASRHTGTPIGASRAYGRAGTALIVSCVLFALASGPPPALAAAILVAAVCALTLGELFASAAQWGVSMSLAPEELRGRYLAVFATATSLQQAIGPAIVSALIVAGGRVGWLGLGVILLVVSLGSRALARAANLPSQNDNMLADAA